MYLFVSEPIRDIRYWMTSLWIVATFFIISFFSVFFVVVVHRI